MVVHGHELDGAGDARRDAVPDAPVTRGAKRPIVVGDMPFGSYQVSDEEAVANAVRFVKEGGADAVKLEGGGPMVARVRAIVDAGHPRDGPHRPDAAVGDDARRLQGAGHDRGGGAAAGRRRAGARGRRAASRSCSRRSRRRSPRGSREALAIPTIGIGAGAGLRRPGARLPRPARADRGPPAAVRQALREARRARSATRWRPTRPRCAAAPSPSEEHTYAMPEEELARVRGQALDRAVRPRER